MSKEFETMAELHGLDLNKNIHNYLNYTTVMCNEFYTAGRSESLQMAIDIARAAACFDDLQAASLGGVAWHEAMFSAKAHIAKLHGLSVNRNEYNYLDPKMILAQTIWDAQQVKIDRLEHDLASANCAARMYRHVLDNPVKEEVAA